MNREMIETADRLLGFDSRRLQREMTDGLDRWHHRREEAFRDGRAYLAATCVAFAMVAVSYLLAPTTNYRLADGVSYEKVEAQTFKLINR